MDDLISRQAAISEIESCEIHSGIRNQSTWNECVNTISETLKELPPVQPDADGTLNITVPDYTMVKNIVLREPDGEYAVIFERPKRMHGKWIDSPRKWEKHPICDKCGKKLTDFFWNFCPNCGADMREEQIDERY